jgi:hypothetical protein
MSGTNRNSFRPLAPVRHELLRLGLGTLIHQVHGLRVALEDRRSQLFHLLVRRMRWYGRHFRIASDIQTRTVGLSAADLRHRAYQLSSRLPDRSIVSYQRATLFSMLSCQDRFSLRFSSAMSSLRAVAASATMLTSVG